MSDWTREDDIKAELRRMTAELRLLREGLRNMVSPTPRRDPARAFLHRQAWPARAVSPPESAPDAPPAKRAKPAKRANKKPR